MIIRKIKEQIKKYDELTNYRRFENDTDIFNNSRKLPNKFEILALGIPILLVLSVLLYFILNSPSQNENREFEKKSSFNGIIIEKYKDSHNHYISTFRVQFQDTIFRVISAEWPESWEYASNGDSIIKYKDSFKMLIKKPYYDERYFFYYDLP